MLPSHRWLPVRTRSAKARYVSFFTAKPTNSTDRENWRALARIFFSATDSHSSFPQQQQQIVLPPDIFPADDDVPPPSSARASRSVEKIFRDPVHSLPGDRRSSELQAASPPPPVQQTSQKSLLTATGRSPGAEESVRGSAVSAFGRGPSSAEQARTLQQRSSQAAAQQQPRLSQVSTFSNGASNGGGPPLNGRPSSEEIVTSATTPTFLHVPLQAAVDDNTAGGPVVAHGGCWAGGAFAGGGFASGRLGGGFSGGASLVGGGEPRLLVGGSQSSSKEHSSTQAAQGSPQRNFRTIVGQQPRYQSALQPGFRARSPIFPPRLSPTVGIRPLGGVAGVGGDFRWKGQGNLGQGRGPALGGAGGPALGGVGAGFLQVRGPTGGGGLQGGNQQR